MTALLTESRAAREESRETQRLLGRILDRLSPPRAPGLRAAAASESDTDSTSAGSDLTTTVVFDEREVDTSGSVNDSF